MLDLLNYQLSILGQYSIEPTPEVITKLMNEINKITMETFLPNIINIPQIKISQNVSTNEIIIHSNLGFVSKNQEFNIIILNERIDFNFQRVYSNIINMDDFLTLSTNILKTIMDLKNLTANRLALNIHVRFNSQNKDKLNNCLTDSITKRINYYKDKEIFEWSTMMNAIKKIKINEREEELNVITNIRVFPPAEKKTIRDPIPY